VLLLVTNKGVGAANAGAAKLLRSNKTCRNVVTMDIVTSVGVCPIEQEGPASAEDL